MIATVDVPDPIADAIKGGVGRVQLAEQFGLAEREARFYCRLVGERTESLTTYLILPDIHFPYHDKDALEIAIDYALTHHKPDVVVFLGDLVDFYKISFWKTDPARMRFPQEIEFDVELIRKLAGRFDGVRKVYISGNHEDRLRMHLWGKDPDFAGLKQLAIPHLLELAESEISYIENCERIRNGQTAFSAGKLFLLHGHEVKITTTAANLSRLFYQKLNSNVLVGHHHQDSKHTIRKTLERSHEGAWTIGCLCDLSPEYAPINNWCHGFALVFVDSDGEFAVRPKQIINGKVL